MDAIEGFAGHVVRTRFADLPPAAVAAVKTFVLDSLGVGVAGGGEPSAAGIAAAAGQWGQGPEATVWGSGQRLPAPSAALANAYQVHALEFDCVHEGAVVHPMATLLAAVLAWAERRGGVSGRDLALAVAVGVDVAAGVGLAARGPMRFFRPATAGALGAVAALGKLAGFDAPTLVGAFGLAGGHLSGTLQAHVEASPLLGLQIGFNARGALTAVDLAAQGIAGPREVLEGRYGYFRLFEGDAYDVAPVLAGLGRTWRVTELSHKPFPSGRLTHGVVDGLLRLQAAHGFAAGEVTRVTARVPPLVARLVGRPDLPAPGPGYARLCLPFVAATALLRGTVDVPHFRGDRLGAAETHALAARIAVEPDGNPDENAITPQEVEVALADGRRPATRLTAVLGAPGHPLTRDAHLAKFRRCWTYGARPLPQAAAEGLIARVDRLEEVADVRELTALLVP
jgi:2-methylcitrate dehydratase PrpD